MIAAKGIIQVPGGRGVFPSLTVGENLRTALWMHRRDREYCKTSTAEALEIFPALAGRLDDPAAEAAGKCGEDLEGFGGTGLAVLTNPGGASSWRFAGSRRR